MLQRTKLIKFELLMNFERYENHKVIFESFDHNIALVWLKCRVSQLKVPVIFIE